jgi:D-threonate/D-erythronate kinase
VHLLGEVLPGLPVGRLSGGVWDGVLVVTKAGGFGRPAALLDVLGALSPSCLDTP